MAISYRDERLTLRLPVEDGAAARARSWVSTSIRLDPLRRWEAQLLVGELVVNALVHGGLDGSSPIDAEFERLAGRARIGVRHRATAPPLFEPAGFGLTLLERLSRRWGHDYDGAFVTVWFEIRTPGSAFAHEELTSEEVVAGASGDPDLVAEVVRRFGSFATSLSCRYRGKGAADGDLEQVAMMGLLKAADRFEPERGAFEPFAAATIHGELKRYLRDRAWAVRVPRVLQERSLEVSKTGQRLSQTLGRWPAPEDIAIDLDLDVAQVLEATGATWAYRSESLDAPNDDGSTIGSRIGVMDQGVLSAEHRQLVDEILAQLPEREATILRLRFFDEMTQSEIAAAIGVSQMHVSRLIARALERLKALVV